MDNSLGSENTISNYDFKEHLGDGAYGTVFRAIDKRTG